mgnify:CR=1 FL=1
MSDLGSFCSIVDNVKSATEKFIRHPPSLLDFQRRQKRLVRTLYVIKRFFCLSIIINDIPFNNRPVGNKMT